jgi:lysophospholipase L1-like esterase
MRRNIALLIGSIIASFFICEITIRTLGFHGLNLEFRPVEYDHELGWRLKPNYSAVWESLEWKVNYETNMQGFRDTPKPHTTANFQKIAVFGDSQAEGWGVESDQMWQARLDSKLGDEFQVCNYGVRGYDILQEFILMKKIIADVRPNLVIQILDANDWNFKVKSIMGEHARYRPAYLIKANDIEFSSFDKSYTEPIVKNGKREFVKRLCYKSALIVFSRHILLKSSKVQSILEAIGLRKKWLFNEESEAKVGSYEEHYPDAIRIVYNKLAHMKKKYRFRFLVAFRGNVVPEELQSAVELAADDFLPIYLNSDLLWKFDTHPNAEGQQFIADEIYKTLIVTGET